MGQRYNAFVALYFITCMNYSISNNIMFVFVFYTLESQILE